MVVTMVPTTLQSKNLNSYNISENILRTEVTDITEGNLSAANGKPRGLTLISYEADIKALYIPLCIFGLIGNSLVLIRYVWARGHHWYYRLCYVHAGNHQVCHLGSVTNLTL